MLAAVESAYLPGDELVGEIPRHACAVLSVLVTLRTVPMVWTPNHLGLTDPSDASFAANAPNWCAILGLN